MIFDPADLAADRLQQRIVGKKPATVPRGADNGMVIFRALRQPAEFA